MQVVKQCHAKPRGGDLTSKHKDTLANQRPDESGNGRLPEKATTTTTIAKGVRGSHTRGLPTKLSYFWVLNWNKKLIKPKKMPSDACHPQCSGRVGVNLSEHM